MDEAIKDIVAMTGRLGLSGRAIAEALMITPSYWSKIASGHLKPSRRLAKDISAYREKLNASGLLETA